MYVFTLLLTQIQWYPQLQCTIDIQIRVEAAAQVIEKDHPPFDELLLLSLQVDAELHGDLHEHLDAGQEVREHGEGAARDHRVDILQAAAIVVGVDALLDHVEVHGDRLGQLLQFVEGEKG